MSLCHNASIGNVQIDKHTKNRSTVNEPSSLYRRACWFKRYFNKLQRNAYLIETIELIKVWKIWTVIIKSTTILNLKIFW